MANKAKDIESELARLESLSFDEIEAKVKDLAAKGTRANEIAARAAAAYQKYASDNPYVIRYLEVLDSQRESHVASKNELGIKIAEKRQEIAKIENEKARVAKAIP